MRHFHVVMYDVIINPQLHWLLPHNFLSYDVINKHMAFNAKCGRHIGVVGSWWCTRFTSLILDSATGYVNEVLNVWSSN